MEVVTADGDTEGREDLAHKAVQRKNRLGARLFKIEGYYRTGQYHWGDEGLLRLFRETYYGPNLDIYDGEAPLVFNSRVGRN